MYGNNEQIKATKTFHDHQIVLCIKLNKRKKENKKKNAPWKNWKTPNAIVSEAVHSSLSVSWLV